MSSHATDVSYAIISQSVYEFLKLHSHHEHNILTTFSLVQELIQEDQLCFTTA